MKKSILILLIIAGTFKVMNAQSIVINERLLTQLTKNQTVRLASNSSILNSYEKQKKLYDEMNQKIAQIVAIQNFIYDKLTNVSAGIKHGKQLYYLSQTFVQIGKNGSEVVALTAAHPEYAILLTRFYIAATGELSKMKSELAENILREDADFLMDPYDRQVIIQNLAVKAQMINGYLICIKLRLKNAKKIPYLYQIPTINTYVNLDKVVIKEIMNRLNILME